jgi:hypothetical protein
MKNLLYIDRDLYVYVSHYKRYSTYSLMCYDKAIFNGPLICINCMYTNIIELS